MNSMRPSLLPGYTLRATSAALLMASVTVSDEVGGVQNSLGCCKPHSLQHVLTKPTATHHH